eukprot:COSAG06_NODE_2263_length_7211_cov_408.654949_3_plen_69_part_00
MALNATNAYHYQLNQSIKSIVLFKLQALNLAEDTEVGCLLRTVSAAALASLRFDYASASLSLLRYLSR